MHFVILNLFQDLYSMSAYMIDAEVIQHDDTIENINKNEKFSMTRWENLTAWLSHIVILNLFQDLCSMSAYMMDAEINGVALLNTIENINKNEKFSMTRWEI